MANKQALIDSLDAFTKSYLETALWSSSEYDADGNDLGSLKYLNYSIDDFTVEALKESIADCKAFQAANVADLSEAYNQWSVANYDLAAAGHDFWLTRNGHGAGFWDRGLGEVGDRLSKACKPYGSVDLQVYRGKVTL